VAAPLLEVEDLWIEFVTRRGIVPAVRGVSFAIAQGESLGLVGESGSGKTVIAQTIMGLLQQPGRVKRGAVRWKGQPLGFGQRFPRDNVRGHDIAMVFQDALAALNPLLPVGTQITEVLTRRFGLSRGAAKDRAVELLAQVGIPEPRERVRNYPHEFSGGMRQRAMIAIALACEPKLLIADEPTTALDVTIQAQIIYLLRDLQQRLGLSLLFITHDLGVIAALCDRVAVVYSGKIAETGPAEALFAHPAHPYTAGLLRSSAAREDERDRLVGIDGAPPDLLALPPGCAFAPRCPLADAACDAAVPALVALGPYRQAACIRPLATGREIGS
jgi:peptide/nickel transport system ATP-binding protein